MLFNILLMPLYKSVKLNNEIAVKAVINKPSGVNTDKITVPITPAAVIVVVT